MQFRKKKGQKGIVLIYTLIFIALLGLMFSHISRNLKLEQQLNFAINQQIKLRNELDNFSRQLPIHLRKNIGWSQLSIVKESSPLLGFGDEINISTIMRCKGPLQYDFYNAVEQNKSKKVILSASVLATDSGDLPSYLLAVQVCFSSENVQFWLSEWALFQYFQDGTLAKLYAEQFYQLKGVER